MAFFRNIKNFFMHIKLIDKCLIFFMFIFLAQSIYSLFSGEKETYYTSSIDIVVRTTSAAIFGYFLSANFIKKSTNVNSGSNSPNTIITPPPVSIEGEGKDAPVNGVVKNKIGFTGNTVQPDIPELPTHIQSKDDSDSTSNQQIIITTIIGVVSLCAILIARNTIPLTAASTPVISHLRDFVSGCVGFLVGCPVGEIGNKKK